MSAAPAKIALTELNVNNICYGRVTTPKSGQGSYIGVNYNYGGKHGVKPLSLEFPLMFSWGASRDDRPTNDPYPKDKYKLSIQFPRESQPEAQTPEIKLAYEKLVELENKLKADGALNALAWGFADSEGDPIAPTLGHSKAQGALLKWPLDKSNPNSKVKKLVKNDPEKRPTVQFKLQQINKQFQCSVFNEKLQMVYCPQNKAGTIAPEICDLSADEFCDLIPKFSNVKVIASLTLWLENPNIVPSLTVQQVLCYKSEQTRIEPSECMFGAPLTEEEQMCAKVASATAVDDSGDHGLSSHMQTAAIVDDSDDDDADVVMPVAVAEPKKGVVVPPAKVPVAAAVDDDEVSDEEAPVAAAKPAPVAAKPAAKKVVVKKAAAK